MKVINNFLSEKECKDLIHKFKSLNGNYVLYNKRYLINLNNWIKEPLFANTIKKFERKDIKINNIEIVFWPIGEFHEWHDDTIYYDITTITYLNEEYEGGRTIVEDIEIKPEIGKYIEFNSNRKHMVTKLTSGERFVLLCWYKNENGKR
jgi:hypothetical protein